MYAQIVNNVHILGEMNGRTVEHTVKITYWLNFSNRDIFLTEVEKINKLQQNKKWSITRSSSLSS